MYYIFMISNNYNQTLYSFQVVVYFLKMHKILTMYFKNTDAKYRYMLPPSHFFEIILPFFRNLFVYGLKVSASNSSWKNWHKFPPKRIFCIRNIHFVPVHTSHNNYFSFSLSFPSFLRHFFPQIKKNQIPPLLKNQNKLASLIYLGGNSRGPRFKPSISNGWGSSRGCGSEQQTSSLGWSWKNFSSSLRQGKHGRWWNCHHGQSCVRLLNPVKFGRNYTVWHFDKNSF